MRDGKIKLVVVATALLVLGAIGFWLLRGEPPAAATAAVEQQQPQQGPHPVAVANQGVPAPIERTEAPSTAVVAPPTDPTLAHVRGRCIDENGAPLGECTVKFDAWGGNSDRMALQGKVDWKDPEPIVTGETGRFDFAFAPPSGMQFSLDVQHDGRVPRTGRWGVIAPAQVIDLGDLRLQPGFAVTGRVVDEQGTPLAKVGVTLQNLPLPIAPDMAANDSRSGFSGDDGEFRIRVPIPIGTWSLGISARGMRLLTPDRVTVTEHGAEPVLVTVRTMPTITGVVVDEQGLPVEGVSIQAALERSGRMAGGRSRQDGTFTIAAVDAEPKPVRLEIDDPGPCEPSWHDERLWPWGSKDVRIELKRALSFELTVVERQSGVPVTQYAVSCYSDKARSSLQRDLRLSGEHEGGRVIIDRVWRGRNFLQVRPIDKALRQGEQIEFEASDAGIAPMRVELDRLQPTIVRVIDASGAAQVGSKIEVVRKGTEPFDAASWVRAPGTSSGLPAELQGRYHELLGSASTGADGRAEVFLAPGASGLAMRVIGQHPPAIVDPAVFVAGKDFEVVVPAGGGIVGRLRLAGLDPSRVIVQLQRRDGKTMPPMDRDAGVVQTDGSFALRGLSPTTYQLALQYSMHYRTEHGGHGGNVELDVEVPDVVVTAGRDTDVDIDATALVPATLRGRMLLDGVVASPARAFVQAERGARFGQFVPGADGFFEASGLPPGTYRTGLVIGDFQAGEGDTLLQEDTFTLAPGQQLERDFVFTRRRLVVTIMQADGKTPAARLSLFQSGSGIFKRCTTDDHGVLVLDPAPAGRITLQPPQGRQLPPIEMPAGKTEHAVTLTLPAAKEK